MPSKITPAATLARVQELHDGGNSFRKIAEILAAEGVPAAGPRSSWHHANVSWCLKEIGQRAESSATWGLSPQLRARLAAQGEEIEGLTVAGLHRLGTGIQETVETELQAIQTTVAAQIGRSRRNYRRSRSRQNGRPPSCVAAWGGFRCGSLCWPSCWGWGCPAWAG